MKKKRQVDIANAHIVTRSEYTQVLKKITDEGFCPFCEEHLMKYHTKPILFKGTYWIVTENAWPYKGTKKHFVLISRLHIECFEKAPKGSVLELHKHWNTLRKKFNLKGSTLLMRSGDTNMTGASVNHLHAQIIVGQKRTKKSSPLTAVVGFIK